MLLGDALDVGVGEVGERDEVALQERQPVVVVAQVERAPQPLGELRHEAERAAVAAGADAVEDRLGERRVPTARPARASASTAALDAVRARSSTTSTVAPSVSHCQSMMSRSGCRRR